MPLLTVTVTRELAEQFGPEHCALMALRKALAPIEVLEYSGTLIFQRNKSKLKGHRIASEDMLGVGAQLVKPGAKFPLTFAQEVPPWAAPAKAVKA